MTEIRTIVYQAISALCPRVFYDRAPQGTQFPYVVFSFPSEGRHYKHQVAKELEVAVYDAPKSGYNVATAIESLTDDIVRILDYRTGSHGETSAWFKIGNRIATPFPDGVDIWGRTLQFTMMTYKE